MTILTPIRLSPTQIKTIVGNSFDGRYLTVARLQAIQSALATAACASTDFDCLFTVAAAYPEIEEALHKRKLDETFIAIRSALQAAPSTYPQTEFNSYKTAVQSAFGVTFTQEQDAQVWGEPERGGVALHFARLGLEAVADAFKRWTTVEAALQCYRVDKFKLFRRIFGIFSITNVATVNPNAVAEVIAPNLVVYRNSATTQWVMTPNNLAHELGHKLDGRAGFGIKKLGSLEFAIFSAGDALHNGFSRAGMAEGRSYLRNRFLEHGAIIEGSNDLALYSPLTSPVETDSEYTEFVAGRYLFNDIAQNRFSVWRSAVYMPWAGNNARIDTLVINETADKTETAADAFLNWVRDGENNGYARKAFFNKPDTDETQAQAWRTFFADNIGAFLRNATIYTKGMSIHYIENGLIRATQTAPRNFMQSLVEGELKWPNARLIPNENNDGALIGAINPEVPGNRTASKIYGWWEGAGSTYRWLLVDGSNEDGQQLVWIVDSGLAVETGDLVDAPPPTGNRILDYEPINPQRMFSKGDICTILGLLMLDCDI